MKKYIAIVAFTAALSSIMLSCNKKTDASNSSAEVSQPEIDTTWQRDSIALVNKTTYDLSFNEVHGPVHTLKTYMGIFTYDEEGRISLLNGYNPFTADPYEDGQNPKLKLTRDNSGKIVELEGWESITNFTWDSNRITKEDWGGEGYWGEIIYTYDEKGLITKMKNKEGDEFGSEPTTRTTKLTYKKFDKYGNWIERIQDGEKITRQITYYPIRRPGASSNATFNPEKESYTFVGTIGGESNRSLEIGPDGGQYIVNSGARDVKFNTYDEATGALVIDAYVSGNFIGNFDGTFNPSTGEYSGTFTNTKGGSVKFSLKLI